MSYELYDEIDPKESNDLTDHQYFLCHSHLYAYVLKDRIYGMYHGGEADTGLAADH